MLLAEVFIISLPLEFMWLVLMFNTMIEIIKLTYTTDCFLWQPEMLLLTTLFPHKMIIHLDFSYY